MSNLNPNEHQSLLSKLGEKLSLEKLKNSSFVKSIVHGLEVCAKPVLALIIAGVMVVAPGCSCANNSQDNTPGISDNGGIINGGSSNNGGSSSSQNKYSEYSEMLQAVLTDSYYKDLVTQYDKNPEKATSGYYDPHPYGFLEDEGYDIDLIKNNLLKCNSYSYILDAEPNNLYIATSVETQADNPYFTEYLLKYTLTDKELKDYNMLHKSKYIQSVFLNDTISQLKEPIILSETRCTVNAHENLYKNLNKTGVVSRVLKQAELSNILLLDFSIENGTFEVLVLPKNTSFTASQKIGIINLRETNILVEEDKNGAFVGPYIYYDFIPDESKVDDSITANIYDTQTKNLNIKNIFSID